MNIRDRGVLERAVNLLDEVRECCQHGGTVARTAPHLSGQARRQAGSLRATLEALRKALEPGGPPPRFATPRGPIYQRIGSDQALRAIARLVGHHGCPQAELHQLLEKLKETCDLTHLSNTVIELTWTDPNTRWVRLRRELIKGCRPVIGPPPDAPDLEQWWEGRGGPPPVRSPESERQKRAEQANERPGEETPKKQRARKKKAS